MNTKKRGGNGRGAEPTDSQNQFFCKDCRNYRQILSQKENLKFFWEKECSLFNLQLSNAKKKCGGKYTDKINTSRTDMKVVKMTDWEDSDNYPQCEDQNNFRDFWDCVKKFLVDKNIKFNGYWHQNWEYGTPLVEYEGKIFAFAVSTRHWGQIMADAFDPGNKDPRVYLTWAFLNPEGEQPTVDENKDPLA
jgi:hypothetical protein